MIGSWVGLRAQSQDAAESARAYLGTLQWRLPKAADRYVGGWVARSLGSWERLVPGKQVGRWLHGIGGQRGWVRVASVGLG